MRENIHVREQLRKIHYSGVLLLSINSWHSKKSVGRECVPSFL